MQTSLVTSLILTLAMLSGSSLALAHSEPEHEAVKMPADFDKVKELAGTWNATSTTDGKEEKFKVIYELTSGGTAVVEKLFAGTPKEMVSVYHADGGKLAMTHYCMMGNHPEMSLKKTDDKMLDFEMVGTKGIQSKSEPHMHGLVMKINDPKHITQEWTMYENGKKTDTKVIELARSK